MSAALLYAKQIEAGAPDLELTLDYTMKFDGSCCCLAGMIFMLKRGVFTRNAARHIWRNYTDEQIITEASNTLGLGFRQSRGMFFPTLDYAPNRRSAVAALERYDETGKVQWPTNLNGDFND